jgi:hypothetical protein
MSALEMEIHDTNNPSVFLTTFTLKNLADCGSIQTFIPPEELAVENRRFST